MIKKKRLLVTGATGMLGSAVMKLLNQHSSFEIYSLSRSLSEQNEFSISCDLTNESHVHDMLEKLNPEIIIHCAAEVNVNKCETDKSYVYQLHAQSTQTLVQYPSVERFIYISTDSVFDGQKGDYLETDNVNPLNYYAYTKLEGERVVGASKKNTQIIRTNLFGFHAPFKNSLFEWAYASLKEKKLINGFTNVYFNPVSVSSLAENIAEILSHRFDSGIYNIGSSNSISKFEFVMKIANRFQLDVNLITPTILNNNPAEGALRPLNTTLNIDKIQSLGIVMLPIDTHIEVLYKNIKDHNQHG